MPEARPKFDAETLQLLESLKGRRKPARRAPRSEAARAQAAPKVRGKKVVVRRSAIS